MIVWETDFGFGPGLGGAASASPQQLEDSFVEDPDFKSLEDDEADMQDDDLMASTVDKARI